MPQATKRSGPTVRETMHTKSDTLAAIREAYETGPLAVAQELAATAVRDRAITTTDYVWLIKWTEGRASWSDVDTSYRPSASEPMGPVYRFPSADDVASAEAHAAVCGCGNVAEHMPGAK